MVNRNPKRTLKWIILKTWFCSKLKCKRNNREWHRDVNCAVQELNSFWLNPCPPLTSQTPPTSHLPPINKLYILTSSDLHTHNTYTTRMTWQHTFIYICHFQVYHYEMHTGARSECMSPLNFQKSFITLSSFSRFSNTNEPAHRNVCLFNSVWDDGSLKRLNVYLQIKQYTCTFRNLHACILKYTQISHGMIRSVKIFRTNCSSERSERRIGWRVGCTDCDRTMQQTEERERKIRVVGRIVRGRMVFHRP